MSTDLTFNSDTTETLPGGIYNITEGPAPDQPPQNMNVDLTFAGPATIGVDNVGGGYQALHDQTINFGILTLTDRLNVSGTSTVTLKGQIFNNQGDIGVAGYYGTNLNIDANIVNNTGTLDPVQYGTVNVKADIVTNNGKMSSEPGSITIDAKILGGTGMSFLGYYASMTLEGGMVGSGQTFDMQYAYNSLTIDAPSQFHGAVNVVSDSMYQVTLADLTATSYSFVNNQLTLYNGSSVVDRLKYTDSNSFGVYQSGSNVIVSDSSHGTAIPLHAGV